VLTRSIQQSTYTHTRSTLLPQLNSLYDYVVSTTKMWNNEA
jgi:hypothetical protein